MLPTNKNRSDQIKWISSMSSGLAELGVTHPIDVFKTNLQLNRPTSVRNLYAGVRPKIVGIVPMRLIFWVSKDYGDERFKHYKTKSIMTGCLTGFTQTFIDHPMEIAKVRIIQDPSRWIGRVAKALHSKGILFNGYYANLLRNVKFASVYNITLNSLLDKDDTKIVQFGKSAISGFTASIVSQPLDYLKTIGQGAETKSSILRDFVNTAKNNPKVFMSGWQHRASISFVGMGIGFVVYEWLKEILND